MKYTLEKSPFLLIMILISVVLTSISITIYVLYDAAYQEQRERLTETVQSQARLMEAIARYDQHQALAQKLSPLHAESATLSQIREAHRRHKGGSLTGEFTIAKLDGSAISFLVRSRNSSSTEKGSEMAFTMGGEYAIPMQKALSGESGTVVAKDYQGVDVLAAYEPVAFLNYGVVAKINLSEIRTPFIQAAATACLISLILTLLSALLFHRLTTPLIRRIVQSEQEAITANLAKDDFLASMSHELRTPLSAVIGNSDFLSRREQDPEKLQMVETINIAGRNQLALINDILDVSKIRAGKFSIDEIPYNLNELVDEIRQVFTIQAQQSNLTLDVHLKTQIDHQLIGDNQRIRQILSNLVGNALKFTRQGGVTLSVTTDQQQLLFEIKDSGIGISEEAITKLFQHFHQVDSSICRQYGGSGLGLYISQTLAQLMGGEISVTSGEGVGSTFTLKLPYKPSLIPLQSSSRDEDAHAEIQRFSGDILIAEDVAMLHPLMRSILEAMGLNATITCNGKEALDAALEEDYDLILMDIHMPVMDGIEATRQLRRANIQIPIIALSANVLESQRQTFKEAGGNGFLAKPIDIKQLSKTVGKYLTAIDNTSLPSPSDSLDATISASKPLFLERMQELKHELSEALTEQNWDAVYDIAHIIKGSGKSFGHPKLSQLAAELCELILNKEQDRLQERATDLLFKITTVLS